MLCQWRRYWRPLDEQIFIPLFQNYLQDMTQGKILKRYIFFEFKSFLKSEHVASASSLLIASVSSML